MNNDNENFEEDKRLMLEYGITYEKKSVYTYQGYKYDRLADAIRYAREHLSRTSDAPANFSD